MKYLIKAGQPFTGSVMSVLDDNGTVRWSDGMTLAQYQAARGPVTVLTEEELTDLIASYVESLITDPVEESAADFDLALNCLPPCRWRTLGGVEMFHISERISHDLVAWHCRAGGRFWTFNDIAGRDPEQIAAKAILAASAAMVPA